MTFISIKEINSPEHYKNGAFIAFPTGSPLELPFSEAGLFYWFLCPLKMEIWGMGSLCGWFYTVDKIIDTG